MFQEREGYRVMARKSNLSAYQLDPAKEDLVIKNMGLVRQVIRDKFSVYHEWHEDMLQEGTIGLIKAVAKHDISKGAQLSTFAYLCIKNEIQKFVSECTDTIRVPVSVGLAINGLRLVEEKGGTSEDVKEVLVHNQVSMEMIRAGKTALATVSVDEENEEGLPYKDILPSPLIPEFNDNEEERQMWSDIHNWLNFNYPDELLNNRVYIDYISYKQDGTYKINEIYTLIANTYLINRTIIRNIIPVYNERLSLYLKHHCRNIQI